MLRCLSVALMLLTLSGCESLFFFPSRTIAHTPAELDLRYEDVRFQSDDGVWLGGWFLPAIGGKARATVVHVHGNAANIGEHVWAARWLPAAGYNVLTFDYRGYGSSDGSPDIAGAQRDISAALAYVRSRPDVPPGRLVVFAQSLGGALAIHNIAHSPYRNEIRVLIVDSAFSSYQRIAGEKLAGHWLTWPLQWLPQLLISDRFAPDAAVAAITPIPLLLIHGTGDQVVPSHHSEQLYERAASPKRLWLLPNVSHTAGLELPANRSRLLALLDSLLADRTADAALGSGP